MEEESSIIFKPRCEKNFNLKSPPIVGSELSVSTKHRLTIFSKSKFPESKIKTTYESKLWIIPTPTLQIIHEDESQIAIGFKSQIIHEDESQIATEFTSQIIHEQKYKSLETGNNTEVDFLDIMNNLPNVIEVEKDYTNSKFDIYFRLKEENVTRGLQIKTLSRAFDKRQPKSILFRIDGINKYDIGTLIVAINKTENIGLAYLYSEQYNDKCGKISLTKNPRGKYSKLVKRWDDFIIHLQQMLSQATIVTAEIRKFSMTSNNFLEYESIQRFTIFCQKYRIKFQHYCDNNSATDALINGFKVQLKYTSNPYNPNNGGYSYKIDLSRSNGKGKFKPYTKGENNFYIIEIGSYHSYFLILPEEVLVSQGFISTDNNKGKCTLHIFPYDYVNNRLKITSDRYKSLVKGNWTCDINYWFSTEKGYLGNLRNELYSTIF